MLSWIFAMFLNTQDVTPRLCELVDTRIDEVSSREVLDHTGFMSIDFDYACKNCNGAGEVLARGYETEEEVWDAWYKSPSHRKIIEDSWDYSCVRSKDVDGTKYTVGLFLRKGYGQ